MVAVDLVRAWDFELDWIDRLAGHRIYLLVNMQRMLQIAGGWSIIITVRTVPETGQMAEEGSRVERQGLPLNVVDRVANQT